MFLGSPNPSIHTADEALHTLLCLLKYPEVFGGIKGGQAGVCPPALLVANETESHGPGNSIMSTTKATLWALKSPTPYSLPAALKIQRYGCFTKKEGAQVKCIFTSRSWASQLHALFHRQPEPWTLKSPNCNLSQEKLASR